MICQLYVLNFPNKKKYIGISKNPKERLKAHLSMAAYGSKFPVHTAIRKYGKSQIHMKVMVIGELSYILDLEIRAIAAFNTIDRRNGYNVHFGGTTSPMHNPEVARQVSESKRGIQFSEEIRKRMTQGFREYLKIHGVEHRAKLSRIHKERYKLLTEEEKKKLSESRRGKIAWNKGIKVTDPNRLKVIRKAAKNRDPEWHANVAKAARRNAHKTSLAMKENWKDPEVRARHKAGQSTIQYKNKMSEVISSLLWITNGISTRRIKVGSLIPDGWYLGRSKKSSVV